MTLDAQVFWDDVIKQWVNADTGQPIPHEQVVDEVFVHADAAQENLSHYTGLLYAGDINIKEWEIAVALELQDAFIAESAFAVGGRDYLDDAALVASGVLLANQLGFLDGFARDIVADNVSHKQAIARINQYGNAVGQAYWDQWQTQQSNPNFVGLHNLNRMPQDGSTICRGNCRCHLDHTEEGILWVTTSGNVCETCAAMEDGNPWAPML